MQICPVLDPFYFYAPDLPQNEAAVLGTQAHVTVELRTHSVHVK
jgi:hypothetical protein